MPQVTNKGPVAEKEIFAANPGPQSWAFKSTVDDLNYGGARGGGKSAWLLMEAWKRVQMPGYRALIARRTVPQLSDLMARANELYPKLGLVWQGADEKRWWEYPGGGFIKFMSFKDESPMAANGVDKIQGHEYQFMGIDQGEQFTEGMLDKMRLSNRSTNPDIPSRFRVTTNPGGVGHLYMKNRYVKPCRPVPRGPKHFSRRYNCIYQPLKPGPVIRDQDGNTRHFIPALVWDNPHITQNDQQYVRKLLSLPPHLRAAMLHGDWDVYEGQFFGEWDGSIHVLRPFTIPLTWPRYVSIDYGFKHAFCSLWHAIDPDDGITYTYREWFKKDKPLRYHARAFRRYNGREELEAMILPHDMWREIPGFREQDHETETIAQRWRKYVGGTFPVVRAPTFQGSRRAACDAMRDALYFDQGQPPKWFVFNTCYQLIETMPAMISQEPKLDEIVKVDGDDAVDAAMKFWLYYKKPEKVKPRGKKGVGEWGLHETYPFVRQDVESKNLGVAPENLWMTE